VKRREKAVRLKTIIKRGKKSSVDKRLSRIEAFCLTLLI